MPRYWHDRHAVAKMEDDNEREFNRNIVADKKPYFMRYIYPSLMKQFNTYKKNTNRNCLREFQMNIDELLSLSYEELSDRQREFLKYYEYRMPVGTSGCIMNKICKRFEEEFDGYVGKHNTCSEFDYSIMRGDSDYSKSQFYAIKKLYEEYNKRLQNYSVFANYEHIDKDDALSRVSIMNEEFRSECYSICSNQDMLCDIILDICYTRNSTKRFAWNMCGESIIHNLLLKNDSNISFPIKDSCGDIEYGGEQYSIQTKKIEVAE